MGIVGTMGEKMVRPRRPFTTAVHPISARFLHPKTYKTRVHVSPFVSPQLVRGLQNLYPERVRRNAPAGLRDKTIC